MSKSKAKKPRNTKPDSHTEKPEEKAKDQAESTTKATAIGTTSAAKKNSAKKTPCKATTKSKRSQPHLFTPKEDEMLAKHWITTPQNRNANANLNLGDYARLNNELEDNGITVEKDDLRKRFRRICKETLEFSVIFNAMKSKSLNLRKRTPEADLIAAAMKDYYNQWGQPFQFESAWHVLRDHAKWMNRKPEHSESQPNRPSGTSSNAATVSTSEHQESIIKPPVPILPRSQPPTSCEPPPDTNQSGTRSTDFKPQTQPKDVNLVGRTRTEPPREEIHSADISTFSETHDKSTDIKPSRRKRLFDEMEEEVNHSNKIKAKSSNQRESTVTRHARAEEQEIPSICIEPRRSRKMKEDVNPVDGCDSTATTYTQSQGQKMARLQIEPRRSRNVTEDLETENGRKSPVTCQAQAEEQKIARLQVEARRLEAETEYERMQLDIMEKDVSTCTDEYEKEFFLFKKRKIISSLKAQEAQPYTSTSQEKQSSPNGPAPTKSLG
ncbi:hypothetical protein PtB15_2B551 [Puccinia triticina]|nr:hypothetical protein PtB15_2B551 [Puccinia triticina]